MGLLERILASQLAECHSHVYRELVTDIWR